MRDLQGRRRLRVIFQSKLFILVLSVVALVLLRSNYSIYKTNRIARMNREATQKQLASLKEKSGRLETAIRKLGTEKGIEDELRNKFQVTKAGEEVLIIVDEIPAENPRD